MNRDHGLFLVIGILIGFISGYLLHEVMAARQPPRLIHGEAGPGAPAGPGGSAPASPAAESRAEEVRSLEAYLAANPDDAEATLRLAHLSFDAESWSRCVELYERYLELRPASAAVLSDLGVCYRSTGRLERALELFDRAQRIDPVHWESRFNQAVVLGLDRRDFDGAERVLGELRALRPNDPDVEALAEAIARRRGP